MSTSFKLTPIAQRKNRHVTRTNGNMNFRSVSGAAVEVMFFLPVIFDQRQAVAPERCTAAAKAAFLQFFYSRPEGLLHSHDQRISQVNARSRCTYPPSTNQCWPVM